MKSSNIIMRKIYIVKGKIIAPIFSMASKNEGKPLNISKRTLLSSSHDWSWSSRDQPAGP